MDSDLKKRNAEVLKKWLDGAEIQSRYIVDIPRPWKTLPKYTEIKSIALDDEREFRLKPKTIKFRTALFKYTPPNTGLFVSSVLDIESESSIEQLPQFVRWLGDWQEVSEDEAD